MRKEYERYIFYFTRTRVAKNARAIFELGVFSFLCTSDKYFGDPMVPSSEGALDVSFE